MDQEKLHKEVSEMMVDSIPEGLNPGLADALREQFKDNANPETLMTDEERANLTSMSMATMSLAGGIPEVKIALYLTRNVLERTLSSFVITHDAMLEREESKHTKVLLTSSRDIINSYLDEVKSLQEELTKEGVDLEPIIKRVNFIREVAVALASDTNMVTVQDVRGGIKKQHVLPRAERRSLRKSMGHSRRK